MRSRRPDPKDRPDPGGKIPEQTVRDVTWLINNLPVEWTLDRRISAVGCALAVLEDLEREAML